MGVNVASFVLVSLGTMEGAAGGGVIQFVFLELKRDSPQGRAGVRCQGYPKVVQHNVFLAGLVHDLLLRYETEPTVGAADGGHQRSLQRALLLYLLWMLPSLERDDFSARLRRAATQAFGKKRRRKRGVDMLWSGHTRTDMLRQHACGEALPRQRPAQARNS